MLLYQVIVIVLFLGTSLFSFFISLRNYKNRNAMIPDELKDVYDQTKYQKWLKYFMEHFRFETLKNLVNTILILSLLFFGGFALIYQVSLNITTDFEIQTLFFIGIYFLFSFIVETAFSYFETFKIEEKYGFNKTTKRRFISDKIKGFVLTVIFGGGLVYLIAVLYSRFDASFYLYTFIVLVGIFIFMNLFFVKLFVPLFNKLTPLEEGELKDEIVGFATKVGYNISKISVINASIRSTKLNAYFSGFGKMKHIVLYDTLIQKMETDEIVSVLAHEIGHAKHKHVIHNMIQTILVLMFYIIALYFVLNVLGFYQAFQIDQIFLGFGLILFMVLLSPLEIILGLVINTISRKHEFEADKYASTNYQKDAMIRALKKLAQNNFSNLTPDPLYVRLMYSHPPIGERIAAILDIPRE